MATVLFEILGELPATAVIFKSLKNINYKSDTILYRSYPHSSLPTLLPTKPSPRSEVMFHVGLLISRLKDT